MIKQAPSPARLAAMLLFALSCFGILFYLWSSFGGPVPLKPKGYTLRIAFPEATALAVEADVRRAGVPIGHVKKKELDRRTSRTLVTVELDNRFAPVPADAKAILRTSTLLGETYVELSGGNPRHMLADGARLPDGHVKDAVQLDEILQALDPGTRAAFRSWQQDFGRALADRGDDANDALGNAPGFVDEATQLTDTLDQHSGAVRALSRNTGEVFGALTRREDQLRNLITNTGEVFDATASQQRALAQTIQILPTFLDESRVTLQRVARFSRRTDPLVRDLDPVLRDAVPTLTDLRALAPDLRDFYRRLGPLITASKSGFPAAGETLRKLRPLLAATGPALSELNPILQWLEYNQRLTAGLFNPPVALADTVATQSPQEIGHYLRSLSPAGAESIALWPQRLPTNRGNAYLSPLALASPERARQMIVPSWDCKNTGRGEFTTRKGGTDDAPSCYRAGFPGWENRPGVFPHINRADYTKKGGK